MPHRHTGISRPRGSSRCDHITSASRLGAIDMEPRRQGVRCPLLLPHGRRRPARARPAQPRRRHGRRARVHPDDHPDPRPARDHEAGPGSSTGTADEVYRLPADDLYLTGTSEVALAGYHTGEIIDLRDGPQAVCRVVDLLSTRGRQPRQGHQRDHPRPPVPQDRDVRLLPTPRTPRPSTSGSWRWSGHARRSCECPIGSSTPPPATSATPAPASSTARLGADPGPLPRAHLDVQLHDLPGPPARGAASATRRASPAVRPGRGHPQRHPRDHPLDRRHPREPPAARRDGRRARGAAPASRG
jgi:hypothetical protein